VDNLFAGNYVGNVSNVSMDATSRVGIDTTAGAFTYATSVAATTLGLNKLGSNALTLSGNNAYSGPTIITAGTLNLNGTNTGSGGVTLTAGTLNINNAGALGTGPLTILSGTIGNTSTAPITNSNNNAQIWNGNFSTSSGTVLNLGTGAVTLNASPLLTIQCGTLTVGGVISGNFGLTKTAAGVLELTGANNYTGTTKLQSGGGGGILRVSGSGTLGTGPLTVDSIGLLDLASSATQTVAAVTLNGGWIQNGTISATSYSGYGQVSSALQGAAATLTASDAKGLFLSGTNSYGGATTVSGLLVPTKPAALPNSGASGTVTVGASGLLALRTGSGQWGATEIGNLLSNASLTFAAGGALGIDTTTGDISYSPAIPATANMGLTKLGPNTLTLSAVNLYPGKTTIHRGTLALNGATGSIASTSALTFSGTGKFNYDNSGAGAGTSQSLGALTFSAGEGTVQTTRTATEQDQALTFTSAARTAGATGNFVNGGGTNGATNGINLTAQALGFINQGLFYGGADYAYMNAAGTYLRAPLYDGTDSGFTLADTITAGTHVKLTATPGAQNSIALNTLKLDGSGVGFALNGGQTLTLANGGLLKAGGGSAGTISGGTSIITSGSTELVVRTDKASDALSISTPILGNTVTKSGAGTLELSGANTFTAMRLNAGTLSLKSTTALGASAQASALTINEGTTIDNTSGAALALVCTPAVKVNGSFTFTGSNDLAFGPSNTGSFSVPNDATFTINAATLTVNSVMTGTMAVVTKNGAGTLKWGGNGTFNLWGGLVINNGVLASTGQGQDYQTAGTGPVALGDTTPGNSNPATLNVSNNNTHYNPITVRAGSSGILALTADNNSPKYSGPVILNNNLTVAKTVNNGTISLYGVISGTGDLNIGNTGSITIASVAEPRTNVGTVFLGAANTYSGNTLVNSGTLKLGAVNALPNGNGKGNVTVTGTLDLNQNSTAINGLSGAGTIDTAGGGTPTLTLGNNDQAGSFSGVIKNSTGTLSLTKAGSGTQILAGISTYTGNTTVSNGLLLVNNASGSGTGTGTVNVASGATLGGTGAIGGAVNVTGNLSPGASIESLSSGTLSMDAGSTFVYEATDNRDSGADLMVVNGTLSLTNVTLDLTAANLELNTWVEGDKLTLLSYTGSAITSGFVGYADDMPYSGGVFGTNQWLFNYDDTGMGGNFNSEATGTSFVTLTLIPEPSTVLLGSLGMLALLLRRRDA
jgi:autotransporter-associated beta strand protein